MCPVDGTIDTVGRNPGKTTKGCRAETLGVLSSGDLDQGAALACIHIGELACSRTGEVTSYVQLVQVPEFKLAATTQEHPTQQSNNHLPIRSMDLYEWRLFEEQWTIVARSQTQSLSFEKDRTSTSGVKLGASGAVANAKSRVGDF